MSKNKSKKEKGSGLNDLDIEGLDDLNFDDKDFENIGDDRDPEKASVSKEFLKETGKGFLTDLVHETAKKSLPEEYQHNYRDAMDYADFAKETFDSSKSKINKSLARTAKEVKRILPFRIGLLDKFLDKFTADNEAFKTQTEEQLRDVSINANLGSIFDKQLEFQKAIEAKKDAKEEIEGKEKLVTNKLNLDILSSIDSNISNQTAFTLQIAKEYYRKSLELQFKSYFIQADMLKTMKEYYKGFSVQFDSITKNTGLPEFIKLKNTERLQEVVRNQITQDIYKNAFTNSDYIKSIKKKMSGVIGEKVATITDTLDQVADSLSMINDTTEGTGIGKGGLIASLLGSLAGSTLGEKLASKISPKFKDKLKDNKQINTGANYLSTLADSPSTFFKVAREKVGKMNENFEGGSGPGNFLGSKITGFLSDILQVTSPEKIKTDIQQQSILNHNQPAIFDNKVHRSITEVIPLYLSKILKENSTLRIMYSTINSKKLSNVKEQDELHYSYNDRKLDTKDNIRASIEKDVFKDKGSKKAKFLATRTLDTLVTDNDKLKKLKTEKNAKTLENYFFKAKKLDNVNFDYKTLMENYDQNEDLKALIEADPKLEKLLLDIKEANKNRKDKNKKIDLINSAFDDTETEYPIETVKKVFIQVCKLNNEKTNIVLKKDEAIIIAKALTNFVINVSDVFTDNIINSSAFSYLPKEAEKNKMLLQKIKVFIGQVKRLKNTDDYLRESHLIALYALLNNALRRSIDVNPEIFQTLADYSPDIFKGKLTTDQFVEGKLRSSSVNQDNYINQDELVNLRNIREKEKEEIMGRNLSENVQAITEKSITDRIKESGYNLAGKAAEQIDRVKNKSKETMDKYGSQMQAAKNNPAELAKVVANMGKDLGNAVSGVSKDLYSIASNNLDNLSKKISTITEEAKSKVITEMIFYISNTEKSINEIIEKENIAIAEQELVIKEAKEKIIDINNNTSMERSIDTELRMLKRAHAVKVKTLQSSVKKLTELRVMLKSVKDKNIVDTLKDIKAQVISVVRSIEKNIEEYKQELANLEASQATVKIT
ncbi:MAG: hypothetical protein ACD_33C00045G0015 [uncultured bacterium]|nr:MAG: hypothetical protein ACD_33C00045G0015 [uncultured bacterium]